MKKLTSLITALFISFTVSAGWSETIAMDDLVKRNSLLYKKFTDIPFTGEVSGMSERKGVIFEGKIIEGLREGKWTIYYKSGVLMATGNFKDGKGDGAWVYYHGNGQLKAKSNLKDGEADGLSEEYNLNGQLIVKDNWKNGKKDGLQEYYYKNGKIRFKANYVEGNMESFECFDKAGIKTTVSSYKDCFAPKD